MNTAKLPMIDDTNNKYGAPKSTANLFKINRLPSSESKLNKTLGGPIPPYSFTKANLTHAVHAFIFATWKNSVFGSYETKAAVLMQMRFDGCVGFPGGIVDATIDENRPYDTLIECLTHELREEMHVDISEYKFNKMDYIVGVHRMKEVGKELVMHFYGIEVTLEDLTAIEKVAYKGDEFGQELFGVFRVPLYTMFDGYRGFPAFLDNNFAGCARFQLFRGLYSFGILTEEEIKKAVDAVKRSTKTIPPLFPNYMLETERGILEY